LTKFRVCPDTHPHWTRAMFEIGIFCVILLAISYWAVLWLMGRREDVLHGEFVESGAEPNEPARPIFPKRPARIAIPEKSVFPKKPVVAENLVQADITKPVRAAVPERPAFRPERLEQLLKSIKRDLNQLVQK
jgi:hypothetical protein